MKSTALLTTSIPGFPKRSGKVRDIYELPEGLLIVATDRISAYDVVMPNGIPDKGRVLTQISAFWFALIEDLTPNHLISGSMKDLPEEIRSDELDGRFMLCRKATVVPIECVVRGYLAGSGWREYKQSGTVCGIKLPDKLKQCDKLPEPIFTPATKAASGHDENVDFRTAAGLVGEDVISELRRRSIAVYERSHFYVQPDSDEFVEYLLGDHAHECPTSAAAAAAALAPPRSSSEPRRSGGQPKPRETPRGRIEHSRSRPHPPLPLAEFVDRSRRSDGRRDQLSRHERTRVLRMLRDEGGRLADDDTRALRRVRAQKVSPPLHLDANPASPDDSDDAPTRALIVGLARVAQRANSRPRKPAPLPPPIRMPTPIPSLTPPPAVVADGDNGAFSVAGAIPGANLDLALHALDPREEEAMATIEICEDVAMAPANEQLAPPHPSKFQWNRD